MGCNATATASLKSSARANTHHAVWYLLRPVPDDGGAKTRRVLHARAAGMKYALCHCLVSAGDCSHNRMTAVTAADKVKRQALSMETSNF